MASSADWGTIESSPEVFSSLLWELGVQGVEVTELWSLDDDSLEQVKPVYALIFLFKWVDTRAASAGDSSLLQGGEQKEPKGEYYFAHQTVQNACATLAIINALLNVPTSSPPTTSSSTPSLSLPSSLSSLRSFSISASLDPATSGMTIASSEEIRKAHNSFSRNDPFALEEIIKRDKDDDDEAAYHYVAYVPIGGEIYELDGLQQLPICHGPIPDPKDPSSWISRAREIVQTRMATYAAEEVHFNLMAIIPDRLQTITSKLSSLSNGVSSSLSSSRQGEIATEIAVLEERKREEERKRKGWEFDTLLRRHNHIGLIHQLLLNLSKDGTVLNERIQKLKDINKEKLEKSLGIDREKIKQQQEKEKLAQVSCYYYCFPRRTNRQKKP